MEASVIEHMSALMQQVYGNPSSTHASGRKARNLLESSRKAIAGHFKVSASEIIFTSSGTEADNLILFNAVKNLGVKRFVSAKTEHHAVSHTLTVLEREYGVELAYVRLLKNGSIDIAHLTELLQASDTPTLVSLMYVNNEIGNLLPLKQVADLCKEHGAYFHSDTVQAVGHYPLDLSVIPADFIVGSAHKFHGPKGVGFAFFRKGIGIAPMLHGGNQEKGARSSTEAVHAIVAMSEALNLSLANVDKDIAYINGLKSYCIQALKALDDNIVFNGASADLEQSSCTILSVRFPKEYPMLLFQLDLAGISVSGGSACQSGSNARSHVLEAISTGDAQGTTVRISFSRHNTKQEIDQLIHKLKELL